MRLALLGAKNVKNYTKKEKDKFTDIQKIQEERRLKKL